MIGAIFLGAVLANLVLQRFFCRAVCPLGALLGLLSRFSLWRVYQDRQACTSCKLCCQCCAGACDPDDRLQVAECMVCMNCLDDCPADAICFGMPVDQSQQVQGPEFTRRELIGSAVVGAALYPLARTGGAVEDDHFNPALIRPPGALVEQQFLQRCVKCGQCMRACPTGVIHPAVGQGGLEGLWTPIMDMRIGYCELNCVLCSQVCPTGALLPISTLNIVVRFICIVELSEPVRILRLFFR